MSPPRRYLIGEEGYCLTSLQSALELRELLPRGPWASSGGPAGQGLGRRHLARGSRLAVEGLCPSLTSAPGLREAPLLLLG